MSWGGGVVTASHQGHQQKGHSHAVPGFESGLVLRPEATTKSCLRESKWTAMCLKVRDGLKEVGLQQGWGAEKGGA